MGTDVFDLTGFQRDLLHVVAGLENASGQDVKAELERRVETVTHARLYPNLDTLVEAGFVEKGTIDRRTNAYRATEAGIEALEEYHRWMARVGGSTDAE